MSALRKLAIRTLLKFDDYLRMTVNTLTISENGGLHPKHRLTEYCKFFTGNIVPDDRVLDIGCGNGYVASRIAECAKSVTAIDIVKKNINCAKEKFAKDNMQFITGDATTYPFKEHYDAIVLSNVLEHIKDRHNFLIKIKNLAPKLLIRVPMIDREWLVLYKKEIGLPYMSDRTHYTEYTMASFDKEMKAAGLSIQSYSVQFGEIWAVVAA